MHLAIEPRQITLTIILGLQACIFHLVVIPLLPSSIHILITILGTITFCVNVIAYLVLSYSHPEDPRLRSSSKKNLSVLDSSLQFRDFSNSSKELTWCDQCNCHTHESCLHCRYCNKCIPRMDHHCFYVNNCIGQSNYRLFLLTIGFLFIHCGIQIAINLTALSKIILQLITKSSASTLTNYSFSSTCLLLTLLCFFTLLLLIVFLFVFYLIILHIELAQRNMTTIEYSRYLIDKEQTSIITPSNNHDQTWTARFSQKFWCWRRHRDQNNNVIMSSSSNLTVWPSPKVTV